MKASAAGHTEIVQELIKRGADKKNMDIDNRRRDKDGDQ